MSQNRSKRIKEYRIRIFDARPFTWVIVATIAALAIDFALGIMLDWFPIHLRNDDLTFAQWISSIVMFVCMITLVIIIPLSMYFPARWKGIGRTYTLRIGGDGCFEWRGKKYSIADLKSYYWVTNKKTNSVSFYIKFHSRRKLTISTFLYKGYKHELEMPLLKAMRDFQKENHHFVRKQPNWIRFIIRLSIIVGITYPVFRLLDWLIDG